MNTKQCLSDIAPQKFCIWFPYKQDTYVTDADFIMICITTIPTRYKIFCPLQKSKDFFGDNQINKFSVVVTK